jgi:N-acetylglucosamine malate deacetylase 1
VTPKKSLFVVAHPDDEVLGAAGTIAKLVNLGHQVMLLTLTDGVSSRKTNDVDNHNSVLNRRNEMNSAAKLLGIEQIKSLNFPDNKLDAVELLEIVYGIEDVIKSFQPENVFTNYHGDLNIDHSIVSRAVMTACRPISLISVKSVYMMEVLSSTEWSIQTSVFSPTFFVDISSFIEKKVAAVSCYKSELRDFPHPRSVDSVLSLASLRGSQSGCSSAEAFVVARQII